MKPHVPLVVISHNLGQRIKISCNFPDIVGIVFNKVFLQEVCNLKQNKLFISLFFLYAYQIKLNSETLHILPFPYFIENITKVLIIMREERKYQFQ